MLEVVDVAPLVCICSADGNPVQREASFHANHGHLHLKLETSLTAGKHCFHQLAVHNTIAALIVGDVLAQSPGERPLSQRVGQPSSRRHLGKVPLADDQVGVTGVVSV